MHFLIPFPNLLTYHTFLAAPAIFFFWRMHSSAQAQNPQRFLVSFDPPLTNQNNKEFKTKAHVELGMFPASSDQNRSPFTYGKTVTCLLGEVTSQFRCSLAFAHCKLLLSHGWRRGGMGKDNMLRGRVIIANQVLETQFSTCKVFLDFLPYWKFATI